MCKKSLVNEKDNILNFEAKRFKQITDWTNSYFPNSKNKPWHSEEEMINELSADRKNRFGY